MPKRCPKCNVVMVEEGTSFAITFWCPVCGYHEIMPKPSGGENEENES